MIISFRYWSIAIAVLVFTLLVGIILGNCLVNSLSVPSLDSMKLIHGKLSNGVKEYERQKVHSLDRYTRKPVHFERSDTDAISPVSDLDLSFINRVLYSSDAK